MTYVLRSFNVEDINRLITEMKAPDIKNTSYYIYGCIILVFSAYFIQKGHQLRHALLTLGTLYLH